MMIAAESPHIDVHSPFTGELLERVPAAGPGEVLDAVEAAETVMRHPIGADERSQILSRLADAVVADADGLAASLAAEVGKPITAAHVEVARAARTARLAAAEALRLSGEGVALSSPDHHAVTVRVPIGLVAAVTPFNFPLNLAMHKVAPAIAAGCPVILKPAEKAPLTAIRLGELARRAGLPDPWLQVVVGPPEPIVDVFCDDPRIAMITFTGSSAIGWTLRSRAPRKKVSLELGNATPVIVAEDADVADAAVKIAAGGFTFAGQSCISVQRVYAHRGIVDDLLDRLVDAAAGLGVGNPLDPSTVVGPLITGEACSRVLSVVDDAEAHGAQRLTGGHLEGAVIAPIVLSGAPPSAAIERHEVFGPVVSVNAYDDFAEAVARANDTEYGLQAAVFTADLDRAMSAVRDLRFGGVCINESPSFRADEMPYGGVKASGNTREGPAYAMREMTEERLALLALPPRRPAA